MIDPLSHYLQRNAGQHGPVMLMYHSVTPGKGHARLALGRLSMQRFRNQLDFLTTERWATPTIAELVAAPEKFTGRSAVITFDDGYVDNLAAWEELQKRGMRATLFMVSGSIGRIPAWPADGRPDGRLLNAVELRALQAAGIEIGSHTVSHVRLTEANNNQLRAELSGSKTALEDALGNEISSFAYPYSAWSTRCSSIVCEAAYRVARQLRRLIILNTDTVNRLARKLYFSSNDISWQVVSRYASQRIASRMDGQAS